MTRWPAGATYCVDMSTVPRPLRTVLLVLLGGIGVLALAYLGWFALLTIGSEEGDIPPASSLGLPEGATVVAEAKDCGSGGCWSTLTVRPAGGSSSAELKDYLDTTFNGRVPGNFVDPRTVNFMAVAGELSVVITASYWTSYEQPSGPDR